MPSQKSFVDYIIDQLSSLSNIRALKMFGEYGLYCDDKIVMLICDDRVYLKKTDIGETMLEGRFEYAPAYPGAKPSLLIAEDIIEDRELFPRLISSTAAALPMPKPKNRKPKTNKKKSNKAGSATIGNT
jgi:TfoX/Sxy family transcriptional regulator of competence genes